jgi:hypothetical protein
METTLINGEKGWAYMISIDIILHHLPIWDLILDGLISYSDAIKSQNMSRPQAPYHIMTVPNLTTVVCSSI